MTAADGTPPLPEISRTALWAARMRAEESRAPDPCFRDPWAEAFVAAAGPSGPAPAEAGAWDLLRAGVAVRTRYFDDYLLDAVHTGCRQVVLLGAGLDTRAFRLAWPSRTDVFEVDLPGILRFKNRVLAGQDPAAAHRVTVAADLRGSWIAPLTGAGLDPVRRTAWLCEGLLNYLAADTAQAVVAALSAHSPRGSRVGAECASSQHEQLPRLNSARDGLSAAGTPWQWFPQDAGPWWHEHGWDVEIPALKSLPCAAARLAPYLADRPGAGDARGWLLTGTRR